MKNKQKFNNRFTFRSCLSAFSICILSSMLLPIHAEEKSAELNAAKAAAAAVGAAIENMAFTNKSNQTEAIIEEVPLEVKQAVEKELSSRIKITKSKTNESASLVFRAPIYKVNQFLGYIAVVDGEVLELSKPNTNEKLPGYLKLIRDDFVLDSQEKAEILESAIQPIIPYKLKKIVKPAKIDHGWIIFRDDFFKNYSGLVFSTDEKGKITFVEYIMKINPKDFSYKKQEY